MVIFIIAASVFVAAGIGTGVIVSKKRFETNLEDAQNTSSSPVRCDKSVENEINRYEQLQNNLVIIKKNIDKLDITLPEQVSNAENVESCLNKISSFFEKNSKSAVGTETFILSLLPKSQIGESLSSLNEVVMHLPNIGSDIISALKDNVTLPSMNDIMHLSSPFFSDFANGMASSHAHSIGGVLTGGLKEVTGLNDAVASIKDSFHDIGTEIVSNINVDALTDISDLDFSGHIPVITIAISSFRELNLLMDNKTDAMTSLKNISLDAAGAGGGGIVGAKAGAIAGSLFGPVGAIIGGIVGGIGGAVGGRTLTNEIKQKPLKNAIEAYQTNANRMKKETNEKSRVMLHDIGQYTSDKRNAFKNDNIIKEIPVVGNESIVVNIAVVIYTAITDHITSMKEKVDKMKSSFWYSEGKYGEIVSSYEKRISNLEKQLPPVENVRKNPQLSIETLLALQIPNQKADPIYKKKITECSKELKELNDKNNSSVLVWSYMVNGLYQKTLNEIVDYTNNQMNAFTDFLNQWKQTMVSLENKVNTEKGKLGLK